MVVLDATTLMLLLHPSAPAPIDPTTGVQVLMARERIDFLLAALGKAGDKVMIPTPVLSEVLIVSGSQRARLLSEIQNSYAFQIEPFDIRAAVELSSIVDSDLQSNKPLSPTLTKAKLKFDRQIIAIAKVHGAHTIYSDDNGVFQRGNACDIQVVRTWELPLPPEPPQRQLPFHQPDAMGGM